MQNFIDFIDGAQYTDGTRVFLLLGVRRKVVVLRDEDTNELVEMPREEAYTRLIDTGVHDHEHFCCRMHNLHASPHVGCIFR